MLHNTGPIQPTFTEAELRAVDDRFMATLQNIRANRFVPLVVAPPDTEPEPPPPPAARRAAATSAAPRPAMAPPSAATATKSDNHGWGQHIARVNARLTGDATATPPAAPAAPTPTAAAAPAQRHRQPATQLWGINGLHGGPITLTKIR